MKTENNNCKIKKSYAYCLSKYTYNGCLAHYSNSHGLGYACLYYAHLSLGIYNKQ